MLNHAMLIDHCLVHIINTENLLLNEIKEHSQLLYCLDITCRGGGGDPSSSRGAGRGSNRDTGSRMRGPCGSARRP